MGKNQHVVSHGERWAVKAEGASQPLAVYKTQSEAWEKAKSIARKERTEALLHGRDGLIRARNTYAATRAAARVEEHLAQGLKISAT
jgi:protein-disulfide isomerase